MEHILQFGISIDDEAIRKRVRERAYDDVVAKLLTEAKDTFNLSRGSYYTNRDAWYDIIDHALHGYFDENKDRIIDLAAQKLAESYKRTKAYKEKMEAAIEDSE